METKWHENIWNKLLITALIVVVFAWGLNHLDSIYRVVTQVVGILSPFILGGGIAFVLNVPMRRIEQLVRRLTKREWKLNRAIAIVLSLAIVLLIVVFVASIVIPEIANTLMQISRGFPQFIAEINGYIRKFTEEYPEWSDYIGTLTIDWEQVSTNIVDFLKNGLTDIIGATVNMATSVIGQAMTGIIGLIFGVYILAQKEQLSSQGKKILYAYLPEQKAKHILEILHLVSKTFSGFIAGQCTEAVILGTLTYLSMTIFRFPYALTIAVLIGFSALLPIVGAVVGAVVGTFSIMVIDPLQAVWFLIMILILQQIEGNIIYPRVVGRSVGLPGMWVLLAVTVGGSLMGIWGMLVFVPLCSVLYALFRTDVYKRLKRRKSALPNEEKRSIVTPKKMKSGGKQNG